MFLGKFMQLLEYDKAISAHKTYISDFFYIGDLRSGHFCDLPNSPLCQWAKNQLRYKYFGASLFE